MPDPHYRLCDAIERLEKLRFKPEPDVDEATLVTRKMFARMEEVAGDGRKFGGRCNTDHAFYKATQQDPPIIILGTQIRKIISKSPVL